MPCHSELVSESHKSAFTLAEVLITLGIIGVVAAMTLPTVINNVQKKVVETKLKVFNTTINNALRMAQKDYDGTIEEWIIPNYSYTHQEMREFVEKYFLAYMQKSGVVDCPTKTTNADGEEVVSQQFVCFTMTNGMLVRTHIDGAGGDMVVYLNGKMELNTRNKFQYQFAKKSHSEGDNIVRNSKHFIEPYIFSWDGTIEHLKDGNTWACKPKCTNCAYCTKLIQLNNWEIPDDYPW